MFRLVLPCLLAASGVLSSAATAGAVEFVPGELIVRFKPGVSGPERADARRDRGATVERALPLAGTQVLELPEGQGVRRAAASFADDPRVLYAEPNYVVRAHDLSTVVDDPFANELWGLDNEQQRGGLLDADIDALEGWGVQATSPAVKVAVLDSGVDLLHPDLRQQLEPGRDFVDGDFVPEDEDGHGTHVAGTVGARGNDAVGLTGVSQDVGIVPVRVLDEFGKGTDAQVVDGIAFAAAAGASVVNLSLGGSGDYPDSVRQAIKQNPGILFVVSAGNSGRNNDIHGDWPCNYAPHAGDVDNVICVAASNTNDAPAGFSNYGPDNVDLAAPGVGIGSTQPQSVRFNEGFDSGLGAWQGETPPDASTWQTSATAASDGSAAGLAIDPDDPEYLPASDTTLRTAAAIDLVGYHACNANFDLRLNVDDGGGDAFSVEVATDPNGLWTEIYRNAADEQAFTRVHAPLPSAFDDESVYLRVRFVTDADNLAGGPFTGPEVDRFEVLCPEWAFMSGTSMATPHVSGAAALVLAQTPALTTAQLRERLLSTGDQSACWTGLTTTGARLNLGRALGVANLGSGPTASSCPVTVAQQEALKGAAPTPAPPPSPAPPTGTDTGTPAPVDDDGPVVTASAARRHRASTLLARGLRARIGCDEACTLRADILIGRRTAKKLGITGRRFGNYIIVGRSRSGLSRAGSKLVITRISRGAHRGLRRARSVRLVLRVLASDEHGNDRVIRRTLTVRR